MNSVEKVLNLCKKRKIPVSKLEKDCGFANAYVRQLKKGTFPAERLQKIADYFSMPIEYFYDGEEKPAAESDGLTDAQRQLIDLVKALNPSEIAVLLAAAQAQVASRQSPVQPK